MAGDMYEKKLLKNEYDKNASLISLDIDQERHTL